MALPAPPRIPLPQAPVEEEEVRGSGLPPPPSRQLPAPPVASLLTGLVPTEAPPTPGRLSRAADRARDAFLRGERNLYAPLSDISEVTEADSNNNDTNDFFNFEEKKQFADNEIQENIDDENTHSESEADFLENLASDCSNSCSKSEFDVDGVEDVNLALEKPKSNDDLQKSCLYAYDSLETNISPNSTPEVLQDQPEPHEASTIYVAFFSEPAIDAPKKPAGSRILESFEEELRRLQEELTFAERPLPALPPDVPNTERTFISIHPDISPEKSIVVRRGSAPVHSDLEDKRQVFSIVDCSIV